MDSQKIKLELENISQSYIVDNKVTDAVIDISFSVKDSEFLVILGPGRCGKTVLLNMIAGLEKPVSGRILLNGEEIKGSDRRIGMVFQKLALMPWKTVMGNVEFGLKIQGKDKKTRQEISQKFINLVITDSDFIFSKEFLSTTILDSLNNCLSNSFKRKV